MKKIIFLLVVFLATRLIAQSYTGRLGYGLSPRGFPLTYSQLGGFFQEVANTCNGGVVMGNGSWRASLATAGYLPDVHKLISNSQPSPYAYTDMLVFGWASYPQLYLDAQGNSTNNWTNSVTKNLFLQTLKSAADSLKPAYLFIGNEINFYWGQDSADFLNWSSFYSQAYDTVKRYSPATKVGTIFNYEDLSGQGALAGWTTSRWGALAAMDTSKMDVIGFTIYPFLSVSTASSVPSGYFTPLFDHIGNKPVVITETGWPADSTQPGALWAASDAEQVTYINTLFNLIDGHRIEDVNWLYLNYLMSHNGSENIFRSVALRDSFGNDRTALSVWVNQCNSAGVSEKAHKESLDIYPNPNSGTFYIAYPGEGQITISLCNMVGDMIFETNTFSNQVVVDAEIPPGMYLVKVSCDGKIIAKKLIRQ